jgi:RNA polymerase sigma-70 factor, ECF subfamily
MTRVPPKTGQTPPQLSVADRVNADVSTVALSVAAVPQSPSGAEASNDAQIMLRVKAGDDAAFDFLVQKFRRQLIGFMYRMTHSQSIAEELAQEVFLRVYRSRESYSAEAKFTTWMYRIATNLALNHLRDTKTERTEVSVSLDEPDEGTGRTPDVADHGLTAEEDLLRKERLGAIRKQVEALPERQRMAVLMHKYQGMDYKEISKILKLSESATKSLLFRAYETLRETLKQFV